jgi:hypothetical protein
VCRVVPSVRMANKGANTAEVYGFACYLTSIVAYGK